MREPNPRVETGALLLCLDLQRAHLSREAASRLNDDRVAACERLLAFARRAGWTIVHSYRVHDAQDGENAPIPGFEPLPSEAVFFRDGASALSNPRLAEIVRGARGGQVLIAGFDLRTSGVATALDAFNQGVRVTLLKDAVWAAGRSNGAVASEPALWDVVAPFARVAPIESVLDQTANPLAVANDV